LTLERVKFGFNKRSVVSMSAAEIKVFSSPAARSALEEIAPQFERATGHRLLIEIANIAACKKKIAAGEAFDIAFVSPKLIDELVQQGTIAADTRMNAGRTGLCVIVRKGTPRPDVSSVEAFRRALLNAKTVVHAATGESGIGFMAALDVLGIKAEMNAKLRPSAKLAGDVEAGIGDLGIAGVGSALANPGVEFVGPLPPGVQQYVNIAAGVSTNSRVPDAARALLRYLREPAVVEIMNARGFEPF
jgi:molybdate transport system substrate-binding protein